MMNPNIVRKKIARSSLLKQLRSTNWNRDECLTGYLKPFCGLEHLSIKSAPDVLEQTFPAFDQLARQSDTGAILLWSAPQLHLVVPPLPVQETHLFLEWRIDPLIDLLTSNPLIGVVLIRLGRYAIGVYEGGNLIASKTDRRYVKGRHRAGGSSANRFARIRLRQVDELMKEVCREVFAKFGPFEGKLEHLYFGGERLTVHKFREECTYLSTFASLVRKRILDIRHPNQDALRKLPAKLFDSDIYTVEY